MGRARRWGIVVLTAAMLTAMLPTFAAQPSRPSSPPAATEQNARIPAALLPRVNASLAADDPAYAVTALPDDATTLRAANPAHRLMTIFTPDGVVTFAGEGNARWTLRLSGIGADTPSTVAPLLAGGRVEYRRGNLTEWYMNGPLGVEQGFTLAAPPASGDALTLTLAVGGGATPRLDGGAVTLPLPGGGSFEYGHLLVTDAAGRPLPARLSVTGDAIEIRADFAGAAYPVTVDPLVETKKLSASDGAAGDYFGRSVAMSSDGTRVIVGAYQKKIGANTSQGAAYVYSGANYATEKKLTASDGADGDKFGTSVAMSGDGTRVIVGAPFKTVNTHYKQGAAYVYSGANYATEQRLTASDGALFDQFGTSVALSSDGTKVIVGAFGKSIGANSGQGVAYVYSGANYATEQRLTASDGADGDNFGVSVAMSGDGARVVVGANQKKIGANYRQGEAYVYSGANYGTETKLLASDGATNDYFGYPVAMSNDGTRVIVGAPFKTVGVYTNQGAAYVYSGANYATAQRLTASDGSTQDFFGYAVAMSSDGAKVIVGAFGKPIAYDSQGAAYVYSGANYASEQRLTASDGAYNDGFGVSVAMSGDGTKVIVGAYNTHIGANSGQGTAYLFAAPLPGPLPPPKPPGPPSGSPGPAPLPTVRPGSGSGSPNPLPPRRP